MPESDETIVIPSLINGEDKTTTSTFDVISPCTGKICWRAASADISDANAAVEVAQTAFQKWSTSKFELRRDILLKTATILESRIPEFAEYMTVEIGADTGLAAHVVLPMAISMLRDIASRISAICGSVPDIKSEGFSAMVLKEPYGVILGIVPWNAPLVFGIRSAATAIATGNTTILKGSDLSPRSFYALGKVFHEAGLPTGVLNVITCRPEDAPSVVGAMISHPDVMKVNFTGSTNVGRKISAQCGQNLKPCLMELGGKNSAIVLDDADIPTAVEQCLMGSLALSGQACMATDRIILHSSIAPIFLDILSAALNSRFSSTSPLPTLVSAASKFRVDSLVSDAISSGAQIHFAPEQSAIANGEGVRFGPIILKGMTEDMRVWKEESFSSYAGVMVVESEEAAIKVANNTGYGLSAAVFTKDLRRGFRVAKKIRTGAVHINSMSFHDEPALPFGGVRDSGWGRFNSSNGMEEFLVTKSVTWDD